MTRTFRFDGPQAGILSGLLSPISDIERSTFEAGKPGWFHKELIRESVYTHPVYGWTLDVSRGDLETWAAAHAEMIGKGHEIPVPDGHVIKALENQGFAREMYVSENEDGTGSLFAWMEILKPMAAEGIRDGTINHVSVSLSKNVKDGLGNEFGPGIDHVCLTNYPVAHNAGPFAEGTFALGDGRTTFTFSRGGDAPSGGMAVSTKNWSEVDGKKLPAASHLQVGDESDPSTWKFPVYEAGGPTVEVGGRTVHKARGALNANAVKATAEGLASSGAEPANRARIAQKLVGLYRQTGNAPPQSLQDQAGILKAASTFSFAIGDEVKEVPIPRLRDEMVEEEKREKVNRAMWAFRDIVEKIAVSETLTDDEKKAKLEEALSDLAEILTPTVRAEILAAVLGPAGLNLQKENPMNEKLLALCKSLGIAVEDPTKSATAEFLANVCAKAAESRATMSTQVVTITSERDALQVRLDAQNEDESQRLEAKAEKDPDFKLLLDKNKAAEAESAKLRRQDQEKSLTAHEKSIEALLEKGTLKEDGAKAARALLGVTIVANGMQFSTKADGTKTLESQDVDIPATVKALLDSLPDGACLDVTERTGRKFGGDLHELRDVKEQKDLQAHADDKAAENLMLIAQPIPPDLLVRLSGDLKSRVKEYNEQFNGAPARV